MGAIHTNRSPEVLHKGFSFLDLGRVDLTANNWAEWNLRPELLRHRQRKSSLSSPWATRKKYSPACHFLRLNQVHHNTRSLFSKLN